PDVRRYTCALQCARPPISDIVGIEERAEARCEDSESQSGEKIGHGGLGGSGHPHHRSQPSARQRAVRRGEHFCPPVPQHPAGPPTWVLESPANTQAKRSSTSSRAWRW